MLSPLKLDSSRELVAKNSKLYLFPLALPILFGLTCILTYIWAVSIDHVDPIFTYISDSGTVSPEMCVFGQLLHFMCILYFGVVYIRYEQVKLFNKLCDKCNHPMIVKVNIAAYVAGLMSILGLSMVANFQEINLLIIHSIGATFVFLGGSVWSCMQAYLSFKLLPKFSSRVIAYIRMVLGVTGLVLYIVFEITGIVAFLRFKGSFSGKDMLVWAKNDKGVLRGTAVISEWIMSSLFMMFITTFIPEYKRLDYRGPDIILMEQSTNRERHVNDHKVIIPAEKNLSVSQLTSELSSKELTSITTTV